MFSGFKIEEAKDDSEFHNLLDGEEFEFRFDIGLVGPSSKYTLAKKTDMVRRIANHFAVVSSSYLLWLLYSVVFLFLNLVPGQSRA